MDAATAQRALLLRELETAQPPNPLWTPQDRAWATLVARESGAAEGEAFIAERTRVAWQRLGPRWPAGERSILRRTPLAWGVVAAGTGLMCGLSLDALGGNHQINLLAPPLWGVVAWNLLVYLSLLAFAWVPGLGGGLARRLGEWWTRRGGPAGLSGAATTALAQAVRPVAAARVSQALHLAAATLGLGLAIGLYWRGLVWDYRATWESTFLSADAVAGVLGALLAPASEVSAIPVPGAAGFAALRQNPQSAAAWIHLFALTLAGAVILPRLALAAYSGWRARRLERHFPLDLSQPYFRHLLQAGPRRVAGWWLLAHGMPSAPALLALLQLQLAAVWGPGIPAQWGPACVAGSEDDFEALGPAPAGFTPVACVDMTATPEAQTQGRWLAKLQGAQAPALLWVDASAFSQRFGHLPQRLQERRQAWRAFAALHHLPCVFSDEDAAAVLGS